MDSDGIRATEAQSCFLCGCSGQLLYGGLRDRLFSAPGVWSCLQCRPCGLAWLDPRPVREDIGKLYASYYTHDEEAQPFASDQVKPGSRQNLMMPLLAAQFGYGGRTISNFQKGVGKVAGLLPLLRDWAGQRVMYLPATSGRLLDVGCGDGKFLATMREEGWKVLGVEPDPEAARQARDRFGIEVIMGSLEDARIPDTSVDAITMHHVIEHVPDPVGLLMECRRILKPDGIFVAITPNVESLAFRTFGALCFSLEPPRHLQLFASRSLQVCAEKAGLRVISLRSISRQARAIYMFSCALRENHARFPRPFAPGLLTRLRSWRFLFFEEALRLLNGKGGEEIVLIAARQGAGRA